jgi:plastocyanin
MRATRGIGIPLAALAVAAFGAATPGAAVAKPRVSVSPTSVQAGASLVVTGRGWTPSKAVVLYMGPPKSDNVARLGTATASRTGRFRKRVRIRASQAAGSYVLLGCRRGCRTKATARLRVTAPSGSGTTGPGGGGGGGTSMGGGGGATILAGPGGSQSGYLTTSVSVPAGGSATFTNYDIVQHDVTADEPGSDGGPLFHTPLIGLGQSAPVAGLGQVQPGRAYGFFCSLHANMRGTLTVG